MSKGRTLKAHPRALSAYTHVLMARLSLDQGLPREEAVRHLDKVQPSHDSPGWLHFRRAIGYFEAEAYHKALSALSWTERLDGPSIYTCRQQALCWMELGEWKRALAVVEAVLKHRESEEFSEIRADILVELGRYKEALSVYDEVTEGVERAFARAYVMERQGNYEAGIQEVDLALREFPTDPELMARRGYLKSCQGDLDGARWDYSLSLILHHDPALLARRALLDVDLGRLEDAARDAELSLSLDPQGELPLKAMAVVLEALGGLEGAALFWQRYAAVSGDRQGTLFRAEVLNRLEQVEQCDEVMEDYLRRFPDCWEGLYYQAAFARTRRNFTLAEKRSAHALSVHPKEEALLYERALLFLEWDRFREAEKACQELLKIHPNSEDGRELLVDILAEFAPERALPLADQLLEQGCSGPALFRKGYVLSQAKRYQEALPLLDIALREDPDNADYLETRSFVRYELGMLQGALRDAEYGLELDSDRTWLKMHRSCLNLLRGNLSASAQEAGDLLKENLFYRYRLFCRGLWLGAKLADKVQSLWPQRKLSSHEESD